METLTFETCLFALLEGSETDGVSDLVWLIISECGTQDDWALDGGPTPWSERP